MIINFVIIIIIIIIIIIMCTCFLRDFGTQISQETKTQNIDINIQWFF